MFWDVVPSPTRHDHQTKDFFKVVYNLKRSKPGSGNRKSRLVLRPACLKRRIKTM
jgi:hypothetical protein